MSDPFLGAYFIFPQSKVSSLEMGQQLSKDLSDPEVTFTVFPQFFFFSK